MIKGTKVKVIDVKHELENGKRENAWEYLNREGELRHKSKDGKWLIIKFGNKYESFKKDELTAAVKY